MPRAVAKKANRKGKEISKRAACPCESGKRYGECCALKQFKWVVDEEGEVWKQIPVSRELDEVNEALIAGFRKVFGREPVGDDPLMLAKYLYSPDDISRETVNAMRRAGMDPAQIHAYEKTGRILTEQNVAFLSDGELAEWDAALDEYRSGSVQKARQSANQRLYAGLMLELPNLIIVLGYLLDRASPSRVLTAGGSALVSVDQYVFLCGLRAVRTLRSICALLEDHRTSGALALSRSLFELYLHIVFVKAFPVHLIDLVDAQLGLMTGTHAFALRTNGEVDRRTIVETATGRRFRAGFSHFRMSRASGRKADEPLFDLLYPHLSSFIHPSFFNLVPQPRDTDEVDDLSEDDPGEAAFYSILFGVMVLDEVRSLGCIDARLKKDVGFALGRVRRKGLKLLRLFRSVSEDKGGYFKALRERLQEVSA